MPNAKGPLFFCRRKSLESSLCTRLFRHCPDALDHHTQILERCSHETNVRVSGVSSIARVKS